MTPIAPVEPAQKRAIVFIDGQNLYHCAREAFGCSHPDYDVLKLAKWVCQSKGWLLSQVRFYTGVPSATEDPQWQRFWSRKLLAIRRQGVWVFTRPLRYRNHVIQLGGGTSITKRIAEEKGIDVRIAIDLVRLALQSNYDVAVVFSQDQDLSEVSDEIRRMAAEQHRWIKMACAFPYKPSGLNVRGINNTDWIQVPENDYRACVDPFDYR